jgi:isoleucyl-tRNA synthetase
MADEEGAPSGPALAELQARVLTYWDAHGVPARHLAGPPTGPVFRFTEGPPTANGRPHIGHVVARALKDSILRYRRMRGDRIVTAMAGWDCHGLPVELEVEKRHGLRSKKEIEAYGVARFCEECRTGALEVAAVWREMSRRMGYWLDYDRPYQTMDAPYIESVWWALSELYRRGLLTKGYYCLPYCPRCETPLSSHEVAQGYRETTDPSVTIRLRLHGAPGEPPRFLLVWTTTPWTLPSNLLVAARADLPYVGVRGPDGFEYILAADSVARHFPGAAPEVLARYVGRDLEEHRYDPPFPYAGPGANRYRVVLDDSVDPKEGTGFVHIAPSFGPEDQRIGEREGVEFVDPLDSRGVFTDAVPPVAGRGFKAADPILLKLLEENGVLFHHSTLRHTYPFCWRCETPLLYRAIDSWFVRTSRLTERLVANNRAVRWFPAHLRDGRFGNFLTEAKDWALSRSRYWGTPLPIWSCPAGHRVVIGSFAELVRHTSAGLPVPFDPHRVTVDALQFPCPECAAPMRREPYTIDGWFDSGSAPFAQYHYPFEPGPFDPAAPLGTVAEGLDQTRGWFYTLLVIATALFDRPAYQACVTTGLVLDEGGAKMSKSKGNAIEPLGLLERMGGDAVRWAFYVSDYTEPMRIGDTMIRQASQRTLGTLLNVLAFYRGNALPRSDAPAAPVSGALLDRWIRARLDGTIAEVTAALDALDHRAAALALQGFVGDLSTWYLRRSRPRLWVDGVTPERQAADATLREVLLVLSRLFAPFAPFMAEAMFQELTGAAYSDPDRTVHAEPWPVPGPTDPELVARMQGVRALVELGRELRQRAGVKARMPLPRLVARVGDDSPLRTLGPEAVELLRAELNVETVELQSPNDPSEHPESAWVSTAQPDGSALFLTREPTPQLRLEGLVREAMRRLQSARKEMRLDYHDRIDLELWADGALAAALPDALPRLRSELLCERVELRAGEPPEDPAVKRWEFDGLHLAARIVRRAA